MTARIDRRLSGSPPSAGRRLSPSSWPAIRTPRPRSPSSRRCRGRRGRGRARHAVHRPDGRRPGCPGGGPARAESRSDSSRDAEHGASFAPRTRNARGPDGLFQSDLRLRGRAFLTTPRGGGRRTDRRRLPAGRGRRTLPPGPPAGSFVRLATPTTDDDRLPAVLANASGFVYYVSITGVTGRRRRDPKDVGAGGSPDQAPYRSSGGGRLRREGRAKARLRSPPADGVVVGSALVEAIRLLTERARRDARRPSPR